MLFNAHDFCGMANHFSMLGLGKSGKITEKHGQHFLQIFLREERTGEQRGHEKVFVSFSVGEHACPCVKQKAVVYAWWPSELQAIRMIVEWPWLEPERTVRLG